MDEPSTEIISLERIHARMPASTPSPDRYRRDVDQREKKPERKKNHEGETEGGEIGEKPQWPIIKRAWRECKTQPRALVR